MQKSNIKAGTRIPITEEKRTWRKRDTLERAHTVLRNRK
jgi:hypothetical protein